MRERQDSFRDEYPALRKTNNVATHISELGTLPQYTTQYDTVQYNTIQCTYSTYSRHYVYPSQGQ